MNKTIEEIRSAKAELESSIRNEIRAFEKQFDVTIKDITLFRDGLVRGSTYQEVMVVEAKIEL